MSKAELCILLCSIQQRIFSINLKAVQYAQNTADYSSADTKLSLSVSKIMYTQQCFWNLQCATQVSILPVIDGVFDFFLLVTLTELKQWNHCKI